MRLPTTRAMMSFGPPGGNGTISLMVLFGKSYAMAAAVTRQARSAAVSGLSRQSSYFIIQGFEQNVAAARRSVYMTQGPRRTG
jgi:hypothetical protein